MPDLWDSMGCSMPGFSVLRYLPEFTQTHVHWVGPCCLTISSSVSPFSCCLQTFSAPESFPKSWLFASGGQSIGASVSASVLPMNIQGWFPLGLTGLISLQSKGLSRVFSSTTIGNYTRTKNLDKHSMEEKCSPTRFPSRQFRLVSW